MTKLYKKNKLAFALIWIAIYVVSASLADGLSGSIGIQKLITAPLLAILSAFIFMWIVNNRLGRELGLCMPEGKLSSYLFYIPLALLITVNLWNGVTLNMPVSETVLYIASMLWVGFLEEIIFRGFLFKALCENGIKTAFAVSSLTFGIGHIVNLLNGAELLPTLLQIVSAIVIGFLFTVIFYKSGSLWLCILTHGIFNSLSAFAVEPNDTVRILTCAAICAIAGLYAFLLLKPLKK